MADVADRTFEALAQGSGWPHGTPRAVVIHATRSGQPNRRNIAGHRKEMTSTINWFLSPESGVSSNLIVSPVEIVRMVSDEDYAIHAGEHNPWTRSIELTQALPTDPYLDGHYELLAKACRPYVRQGVPPIYLSHYSNGMEGFTGHEDSEQGVRAGKSDPGLKFDWDRFIAMLKEDDMPDPRLDEMIKRVGGEPKVFKIKDNGSPTGTRNDTLTYMEHMQLDALGLIVTVHEHEVTGTAK